MTQISAKRDALAYNDSPVRKKEKWSLHLMLHFSERLERWTDWFLPRLICSTDGIRSNWIPGDCREQAKSVRVACCDMALHGQEKTHELKLLPQKEKSGACIQHPRSSKGCLREWYGSHLTNDADKEPAHLDMWWPLRARKRGEICKTRGLEVLQEDAKWSERLWVSEKETCLTN